MITGDKFHFEPNQKFMRLTNGIGRRLVWENTYARELFDKLKKHEDMEDELGLPLADLSELSKIYMKDKEGNVYEITQFGFDFHNKRIVGLITVAGSTFPVCAFFEDKGKTWATIKGDLE